MPPKISNHEDQGHAWFPFLNLPLELRNMVYRRLLVHGYTRLPRSYDKKGVESWHRLLWNFDFSILRVNRQLSSEARHIFHAENGFIAVDVFDMDFYFRKGQGLRGDWPPNERFASGKAFDMSKYPIRGIENRLLEKKNFKSVSLIPEWLMSVSLSTYGPNTESPWGTHILHIEDVPQFCLQLSTEYWALDWDDVHESRVIEFRLNLDSMAKRDASDLDLETRLLEPFQTLRAIQIVNFGGFKTKYCESIDLLLRRPSLNAEDVFQIAEEHKSKGDLALEAQQLLVAQIDYINAHQTLDSLGYAYIEDIGLEMTRKLAKMLFEIHFKCATIEFAVDSPLHMAIAHAELAMTMVQEEQGGPTSRHAGYPPGFHICDELENALEDIYLSGDPLPLEEDDILRLKYFQYLGRICGCQKQSIEENFFSIWREEVLEQFTIAGKESLFQNLSYLEERVLKKENCLLEHPGDEPTILSFR